jgi:hypothetical protein
VGAGRSWRQQQCAMQKYTRDPSFKDASKQCDAVVCGTGRVVYIAREALTAAASASSGTRRDSGRASRGREAATVAMIDHESR